MQSTDVCPCGSGKIYGNCCEPFHLGTTNPSTAESLMRSRYSAYALQLKSYLLETWAEITRPGDFDFEAGLEWSKLRIIKTKKGQENDKTGMVMFKASFKLGDETANMTEKSQFIRNPKGHWVYLSGEVS